MLLFHECTPDMFCEWNIISLPIDDVVVTCDNCCVSEGTAVAPCKGTAVLVTPYNWKNRTDSC